MVELTQNELKDTLDLTIRLLSYNNKLNEKEKQHIQILLDKFKTSYEQNGAHWRPHFFMLD